MELFYGVLGLSGAVYVLGVWWLIRGLGKPAPTSTELPAVAVHVAARNEAAAIEACLDALQRQDYDGPCEVIVVDDRSSDETAAIVRRRMASWPALRLVNAPVPARYRCPKKNALAAAIEANDAPILLFTDADCAPAAGWVRAMVRHFTPGVGLVAGYAPHERIRGLKSRLLALDNLAVAALAAGSIGQGAPLACTGRSLAYRRQVWDEVGGFARIGHLIGGDDVYFMRLLKDTRWQAAYQRQADGIVPSSPGDMSWRGIAQQKLRHAAKAGHYSGPALALAAAVYLFHACLLGGGAAMLWQGRVDLAVLGVWAARWGLDAGLLWRFAPGKADRRLLLALPLLEICYIPYVLLFTAAGRLGFFRWK